MLSTNISRCLLVILLLCVSLPAYSLDPKRRFFQYVFDNATSRIDLPPDILDVQQDQEGFLWLATSRGLAKYDGIDVTLFRVSRYPDVLSNNPKNLFIDSRNRLFVASERGVSLYEDGQFRSLIADLRWATRVNAFAEDNAGNIWFGSDEGLWRYQNDRLVSAPGGEDIKQIRSLLWHEGRLLVGARGNVYTVSDTIDGAISLPADYSRSRVRDLEVHQGQVWLATRRGLLTLQKNDDESIDAVPFDNDESRGLALDRLLADKDENLWFSGRRQFGRILPDGEVEVPNVTDESLGLTPEVTQLFEDRNGHLWQTSRFFGLMLIRDSEVERISYTEGLVSPVVTAVVSADDGNVYVASANGISRIADDSTDVILTEIDASMGPISTLAVDDSNQLWIGSNTGLLVYSLELQDWVAPPNWRDSEIAINAIVKGTEGEMWVATEDGLFRADGDDVEAIPEMSDVAVKSVLIDRQERIWLGTDAGISRIDSKRIGVSSSEAVGNSHTYVSLVEMPGGEIVAATSDRGIAVYSDEHWTEYGESDGIPPEQLIDMIAHGNHLWLTTSSGVFRATLPAMNGDVLSGLDVQPVIATSRYRSAHDSYCCRGSNDVSAAAANGLGYVLTDDGVIRFDLDISTDSGLPPNAYIRSASIDGEALSLSSSEIGELSSAKNELRIEYSAIQLDRGYQVAFRYRLLGLSNDWIDSEYSRVAQFQNLPPGDYKFEVQASFQPDQWSGTTASLEFVRNPSFTESAAFRFLVWSLAAGVTVFLIWFRMASTRERHRQLEAEIRERTSALRDLNKELQSANDILRLSSQTDPLTGLVNRRFFEDASGDVAVSDQVARQGVVMVIDIDFFKRVNDSYGHAAGDEVLCQFASVLRSCVRQTDLVVRWGGEEFVLICRCPNDDAGAMLDRVCAAVREHTYVLSSGKQVELTCSIGCIRYPLTADDSLEERMPVLMELADAALYVVKMSGRDGWSLLERGSTQLDELQTRPVGPNLSRFVDKGDLLWTASRPGINPSLDDTHTRLRAIRNTRG